jgi:hypothetical protein
MRSAINKLQDKISQKKLQTEKKIVSLSYYQLIIVLNIARVYEYIGYTVM